MKNPAFYQFKVWPISVVTTRRMHPSLTKRPTRTRVENWVDADSHEKVGRLRLEEERGRETNRRRNPQALEGEISQATGYKRSEEWESGNLVTRWMTAKRERERERASERKERNLFPEADVLRRQREFFLAVVFSLIAKTPPSKMLITSRWLFPARKDA